MEGGRVLPLALARARVRAGFASLSYGVMLTLMDTKVDGVVRERMLVAFYR